MVDYRSGTADGSAPPDVIHAFDRPPRRSRRESVELLRGNGAGLAGMTSVLGMTVPPGFVLTVQVCRRHVREGRPVALDGALGRVPTEVRERARNGRRRTQGSAAPATRSSRPDREPRPGEPPVACCSRARPSGTPRAGHPLPPRTAPEDGLGVAGSTGLLTTKGALVSHARRGAVVPVRREGVLKVVEAESSEVLLERWARRSGVPGGSEAAGSVDRDP